MWGQSLYQENLPALLLIDWRFQNLDTYMLYLSHMIMIIDYVRLSQMVGNDCTWVGWLRQAITKMHLILLSRPTVPPTDPANPSIDLLIKPNSSSRPNFWCRQGVLFVVSCPTRLSSQHLKKREKSIAMCYIYYFGNTTQDDFETLYHLTGERFTWEWEMRMSSLQSGTMISIMLRWPSWSTFKMQK